MGSKNPFFSVIVLAYQVQPYIQECLNSILNQTFQDFEIIVVVPEATDGTELICEEYAAKYNHISLLKMANEGQLLNRIAGFKRAVGKYLICIDGDDYWKPILLETVYNGLEEKNCDLVIFRYEYVKNDEIIQSGCPGFSHKAVFEGEEKKKVYEKYIEGTPINEVWTKVMSKELFLKIKEDFKKYSSVRLGEDVIFCLFLTDYARCILYIDRTLYCYRWRADSITQKFSPNLFKDKQIVVYAIEQMMHKWGMDDLYYYNLLYRSLAGFFVNYIFRCSISPLNFYDRKRLLFEISQSKLYKESLKFQKDEIYAKRIKVFVTLFRINPVCLLYFASIYRFAKKLKERCKSF